MRETRSSGSVRGASGNGRPYRERSAEARLGPSGFRFLAPKRSPMTAPTMPPRKPPGLAGLYDFKSSGTLPPLSANFCMTCLCSQMFIAAESFISPV